MASIEKIRVGGTEYNIVDSQNIAPVEESTTSANAYAVGDTLIFEGQLYDVISAIAVGNTLSIGTNIQASSVGAKLKEINTTLTYDTDNLYVGGVPAGVVYNVGLAKSIATYHDFKLCLLQENTILNSVSCFLGTLTAGNTVRCSYNDGNNLYYVEITREDDTHITVGGYNPLSGFTFAFIGGKGV